MRVRKECFTVTIEPWPVEWRPRWYCSGTLAIPDPLNVHDTISTTPLHTQWKRRGLWRSRLFYDHWTYGDPGIKSDTVCHLISAVSRFSCSTSPRCPEGPFHSDEEETLAASDCTFSRALLKTKNLPAFFPEPFLNLTQWERLICVKSKVSQGPGLRSLKWVIRL